MILGMVLASTNIFLTRNLLRATRATHARTLPVFPAWSLRPFFYTKFRRVGAVMCVVVAMTGIAAVLPGVPGIPRIQLGADFRAGTEILLRVPNQLDSTRLIEAAALRIPGEWKTQTVRSFRRQDADSRVTYRLTTSVTGLGTVAREAGEAGSQGDAGARVVPFSQLLADFRQLSVAAGGALEVVSVMEVGPAIATSRLRQVAGFVALSIVAVLLYLWWVMRIDFSAALGLFFASIHDVLAMLAVLAIAGLPITYAVVGAILAVVGYSVNDSIILLVRIRTGSGPGGRGQVEIGGRDRVRGHQGNIRTDDYDEPDNGCSNGRAAVHWRRGAQGFALTVTAGVVFGTLSTFFVVAPLAARHYAAPPQVPEPRAGQPAVLTAGDLTALINREPENVAR